MLDGIFRNLSKKPTLIRWHIFHLIHAVRCHLRLWRYSQRKIAPYEKFSDSDYPFRLPYFFTTHGIQEATNTRAYTTLQQSTSILIRSTPFEAVADIRTNRSDNRNQAIDSIKRHGKRQQHEPFYPSRLLEEVWS